MAQNPFGDNKTGTMSPPPNTGYRYCKHPFTDDGEIGCMPNVNRTFPFLLIELYLDVESHLHI